MIKSSLDIEALFLHIATTDHFPHITVIMDNTSLNIKESFPQVAKAFRAAAIKRNAKTALFLGIASSGAIISAPALAVTVVGSFTGLYLWDLTQKKLKS